MSPHYDSEELRNEQLVRQVDERHVVVLKDVRRFPVYGKANVFSHTLIAICTAGVGHLQLDLHEVEIKKNFVAVLAPNHVFKPIDSSIDFSETIVVISNEMIEETFKHAFSRDHQKYRLYPSACLLEEQVNELLSVIDVLEMLAKDRELPLPHQKECLKYALSIFIDLLNFYRFRDDYHQPTKHKGDEVFDKFCELLAENYKKQHMLQFYAKELGYSPKYLARLIHDTTGVDATEWIQQYITAQAKQIIKSRPDLSLKEIGEAIGFTEPAAFSRFFKREAGITPKEYRKENLA